MDFFSNLPSDVIEIILRFLTTQEAARTSILSKEWRYRWIKIPKVTFIEDTFQVSADLSVLEHTIYTQHEIKMMFIKPKFVYAINQVLSMHEGPIYEFTLSMKVDDYNDEIDHIISNLAQRNTVKKLELFFNRDITPFSLFHKSTDRWPAGRFVSLPQTFNGFRSLTSLSVQNVLFETKQFQHLLSSCPLLKTVTLHDLFFVTFMCEHRNISNFFECLPVTETLSISLEIIEVFRFWNDKVPRELPTALVHLKYLSINGLGFIQGKELSILVLLINSSPNLEKLKIENTELRENFSCCQPYLPPIDDIWSLEDYADIWLEHLNELHISHFINWGNELDIVKLILAKSPVLRKVIYHEVSYEEGLQISEAFLSCPRASPVVEIIF